MSEIYSVLPVVSPQGSSRKSPQPTSGRRAGGRGGEGTRADRHNDRVAEQPPQRDKWIECSQNRDAQWNQRVENRSVPPANQEMLASHIEAGDQPRILVIVGDFVGWERGGDWSKLDFMFSHGTKIAFGGENSLEDQLKMFVGAGYRNAPVGYFETERLDVAGACLFG